MKNEYTCVTYKNNQYIVAKDTKGNPFIIDAEQLTKLPDRSYFSLNGYIGLTFNKKCMYLHHLIKQYNGTSIDHINQIKTDNRKVNLRYATQTDQNKNQSKKKRTLILPEDCNIDSQDIPTFIWYIKAETGTCSHGDRWVVEIKNKYTWKTTSSKLISTKCKFELAKQHLRELIQTNPELFEGHCMNGELNEEAEILKLEYIDILKLATINYSEIKPKKHILLEDLSGLLDYEIQILRGEDINKIKYNKQYNLPKNEAMLIQTKLQLTQSEVSNKMKDDKEHLTKCFQEWIKIPTKDLILDCKYKDILNIKTNTKAEDMIFNLSINEWSKLNIKPILEFCETNSQIELYSYFRKKVSSLPTTGVIGRSIRILVNDTFSNKYIGIMCLSSDVYSLGVRDAHLGLNKSNKDQVLKNVMNLSCCVPLQPFGFNTTGGKLIASLAFSKEIFDYYLKKYKEPLLGIVTTSINGKSIQYDRLKCLKFIGFTKGYGTVYFPDNLYNECKKYNEKWKIVTNDKNRLGRLYLIKSLISHLGLPSNTLFHGIKRGVYFGYLFSTQLSDQYNILELQTVNTIFDHWKNRWCNVRIQNLIKCNKLNTDTCLYTIEHFNHLDFIQYNLPTNPNSISHKKTTQKKEKRQMPSQQSDQRVYQKGKNLPEKCNINPNDIPKYCYYIPKTKTKGDGFCCQKTHPNNPKDWFTTKSKYISTDIKFKQLLDYIQTLENPNVDQPKQNIEQPKRTTEIKRETITKTNSKHIPTDILLDIIELYFTNITTEEASKKIKNKFNYTINRNEISQVWKGKLPFEELKDNDNYQKMIQHKRQRVIRRKFTNEELDFLKNYQGSIIECSKKFSDTYNKTVSKEYISTLRKKLPN